MDFRKEENLIKQMERELRIRQDALKLGKAVASQKWFILKCHPSTDNHLDAIYLKALECQRDIDKYDLKDIMKYFPDDFSFYQKYLEVFDNLPSLLRDHNTYYVIDLFKEKLQNKEIETKNNLTT